MKGFKARRISSGLSQAEFAAKLGISQVSVWQWENEDLNPRADKLPAIARLLGCTIDELLEDSGSTQEERVSHELLSETHA